MRYALCPLPFAFYLSTLPPSALLIFCSSYSQVSNLSPTTFHLSALSFELSPFPFSCQQNSKAFLISADKLNQIQADRSKILQALINRIAESYNPAYGQKPKTAATGQSTKCEYMQWFFRPVLAPLLQSRWFIIIFAGVGVVQLALTITGLTGWQCPIRSTFGVTCPGCGLTTAMAMLLRGNWQMAVQTHAFAPLLLIILMSMLVAIALPAAYLSRITGIVARLEQKTGIAAIILLSMVIYWLLRVFDFI